MAQTGMVRVRAKTGTNPMDLIELAKAEAEKLAFREQLRPVELNFVREEVQTLGIISLFVFRVDYV